MLVFLVYGAQHTDFSVAHDFLLKSESGPLLFLPRIPHLPSAH